MKLDRCCGRCYIPTNLAVRIAVNLLDGTQSCGGNYPSLILKEGKLEWHGQATSGRWLKLEKDPTSSDEWVLDYYTATGKPSSFFQSLTNASRIMGKRNFSWGEVIALDNPLNP